MGDMDHTRTRNNIILDLIESLRPTKSQFIGFLKVTLCGRWAAKVADQDRFYCPTLCLPTAFL